MKKRREGLLTGFPDFAEEGNLPTPEQLEAATKSVFMDLAGFLVRAKELAAELSEPPGSMRARAAANLDQQVAKIELALKRGVDPGWLYFAVRAGFDFGQLSLELQEDRPSGVRGLTISRYLKLRAENPKREALLKACGMSEPGLLKWERKRGLK